MRKKKVENNITNEDLFQKTLNKALFFLKFRPRSEKEIKDYLKKYLFKQHLPQDTVEKTIKMVINRLLELEFINDHNFVRLWVENRFKTNPKGRKVIIYELRQKGVPAEIIDEVLDKEIGKYSESEVIKELSEKADRRYRHLPYLKRKEKLINFVARRGFSFSKVVSRVDEMLKKGVE